MKKYIKILVIAAVLIAVSVLYASGYHKERIYNPDFDVEYTMCQGTGILSEGVLEQKFIATTNKMDGFAIKTTVHGDVSQVKVKYQIVDEKGNVLVENNIPAIEMKNDKFYEEKFNSIELEKKKTYTLIIEEQNATETNGVGFYFAPPEKEEDIFVIRENKTLGITLVRILVREFQMETFIVLMLFIIYMFLFMKILYKLFK